MLEGLLQSLLLLFPPLNEMTQLFHCSRKNKSTRTPHVIFVCLEDVSVSVCDTASNNTAGLHFILFYYIHSKLGESPIYCTVWPCLGQNHNQWSTKIQLSSYRHIWQRTHKDHRTAISRPPKLVRPCFGENIREKPRR